MSALTSVGRLLAEIHRESASVRDTVARAAGISLARADGAMLGTTRLSLSEQLRVCEATLLLAPTFSRTAIRLRGHALAARSFENGEHVDCHFDAPVERWERSASLRR
jgi:hypothetical protein